MVYKNEGRSVLNKGICEANLWTNNNKVSSQLINFSKIRLTGIVGNTKSNIYEFVFSIIVIATLSPIIYNKFIFNFYLNNYQTTQLILINLHYCYCSITRC